MLRFPINTVNPFFLHKVLLFTKQRAALFTLPSLFVGLRPMSSENRHIINISTFGSVHKLSVFYNKCVLLKKRVKKRIGPIGGNTPPSPNIYSICMTMKSSVSLLELKTD